MITDRAKLGIAKYTRINDLRLLKWTFKGVKENWEKNRNFVLMLEVCSENFCVMILYLNYISCLEFGVKIFNVRIFRYCYYILHF